MRRTIRAGRLLRFQIEDTHHCVVATTDEPCVCGTPFTCLAEHAEVVNHGPN